jgi:hypothetical protein
VCAAKLESDGSIRNQPQPLYDTTLTGSKDNIQELLACLTI